MSKNSEAVKEWRKRTKIRLVEAMGGKCVCCGYNRCIRALKFHHSNPDEKEAGVANVRANIKSWKKIVAEIKKCVLVCGNCHDEIHEGIREIPKDVIRFNSEYEKYKKEKIEETDECPVCGGLKPKHRMTCSRSCAARKSVKWGDIPLRDMLKNMSIQQVADKLGVSNGAVRKRMKRTYIQA